MIVPPFFQSAHFLVMKDFAQLGMIGSRNKNIRQAADTEYAQIVYIALEISISTVIDVEDRVLHTGTSVYPIRRKIFILHLRSRIRVKGFTDEYPQNSTCCNKRAARNTSSICCTIFRGSVTIGMTSKSRPRRGNEDSFSSGVS